MAGLGGHGEDAGHGARRRCAQAFVAAGEQGGDAPISGSMGGDLEFSPQGPVDHEPENAGAHHGMGSGVAGGRGGIVKAHHQHTVVTLVEDTGKAHDIVGHAPKEPGTLGEQSAVDVAAVPVPILYYDLISPGGEEAAAAAASKVISRAIGA